MAPLVKGLLPKTESLSWIPTPTQEKKASPEVTRQSWRWLHSEWPAVEDENLSWYQPTVEEKTGSQHPLTSTSTQQHVCAHSPQ